MPASGTARKVAGGRPVGAAPRKLDLVIDDTSALEGFSRVKVSMVLTDPAMRDNPIVYVNNAFERTTGYARSAVIGRNCRFLQGERTSKRDVDRLREAIRAGDDTSVDIQNYRADGRPFLNRLIIAPISDREGNVVYFLGIQKELADGEREDPAADTQLAAVRSRVREDLSIILEGIGESSGEPFSFESMTRRIECLELAYESMKLSDEHRPGRRGIDLGALLSRVGASIAQKDGRPGLRYQQNIEPATINLDAAIRVALLTSEVLSNAFQHAFDRLDEGVVELRLMRLTAGGLRITVTDDGVGLPSNAPFPDLESVGGRLIAALIDGLDATLSPVRGAAGTVVMIDVPAGVSER